MTRVKDCSASVATHLDYPSPLHSLHLYSSFFNGLLNDAVFDCLFLFVGHSVRVGLFLFSTQRHTRLTFKTAVRRQPQHSPSICNSVSIPSRGPAYHAATGKRHKVCTDSVVGQIYWGCGIHTHTEDLHKRLSVTAREKRDINRQIKESHSPTTHSVTPSNSLLREGIVWKDDPLENTIDNTITGEKHLFLCFTTDTCTPEFKMCQTELR